LYTVTNKTFFCSWSGGKDSCLALHHAIKGGGIPKYLFTMLTEDGIRSRAHGLPPTVLRAQSASLGIPLLVRNTSWEDYETNFLSAISELKKQNIECGVFGDIDLAAHLEWVERVCGSVEIGVYEPLWKRARKDLLEEFLRLRFKALIISVKQDVLDKGFLGQELTEQVISELEKSGIDASGEEGEYHTVVTDGPIFSSPVLLQMKGQVVHDGYCFLDVDLLQ